MTMFGDECGLSQIPVKVHCDLLLILPNWAEYIITLQLCWDISFQTKASIEAMADHDTRLDAADQFCVLGYQNQSMALYT